MSSSTQKSVTLGLVPRAHGGGGRERQPWVLEIAARPKDDGGGRDWSGFVARHPQSVILGASEGRARGASRAGGGCRRSVSDERCWVLGIAARPEDDGGGGGRSPSGAPARGGSVWGTMCNRYRHT